MLLLIAYINKCGLDEFFRTAKVRYFLLPTKEKSEKIFFRLFFIDVLSNDAPVESQNARESCVQRTWRNERISRWKLRTRSSDCLSRFSGEATMA